MNFLLYQSACVFDQLKTRDLEIMRVAMRNNKEHGITGFLHRDETHFIQYIEGPGAAVDQLAENLKLDHRHDCFTVLASGRILHRRFPDWSMGRTDDLALPVPCDDINVAMDCDTIIRLLLDAAAQQKRAVEAARVIVVPPRIENTL